MCLCVWANEGEGEKEGRRETSGLSVREQGCVCVCSECVTAFKGPLEAFQFMKNVKSLIWQAESVLTTIEKNSFTASPTHQMIRHNACWLLTQVNGKIWGKDDTLLFGNRFKIQSTWYVYDKNILRKMTGTFKYSLQNACKRQNLQKQKTGFKLYIVTNSLQPAVYHLDLSYQFGFISQWKSEMKIFLELCTGGTYSPTWKTYSHIPSQTEHRPSSGYITNITCHAVNVKDVHWQVPPRVVEDWGGGGELGFWRIFQALGEQESSSLRQLFGFHIDFRFGQTKRKVVPWNYTINFFFRDLANISVVRMYV